jgi:hypothetical protein
VTPDEYVKDVALQWFYSQIIPRKDVAVTVFRPCICQTPMMYWPYVFLSGGSGRG